MRDFNIEDLLPREPIEVDMKAIAAEIKEKCILVTGAAGSIGYELTLQIASFQPKMLILIDQAESPLYDLMLHLHKAWSELTFDTIVTSVTKVRQMNMIFDKYRPDYVFHAAAYKHVPMMEMNPANAIQNNCLGTRVCADLAAKYHVRKFVMISTDKAVNPTNVMGCSKRICEIYCQSLNRQQTMLHGEKATQFVTTRFGNVLGSSGSVIPIFEQQLEEGGPLTVTHPDIIRYFMLIPEACKLVLEACLIGNGGEIFAFDMGHPVKIAELAQRMIDLNGNPNIKIKYVGLRSGEKLYEEVLNVAEEILPTRHPKINISKVREYDFDEVLKNETELEELSYSYDSMAIVKKMKDIVPEVISQHSIYEVLDLKNN